MTRKYESDNNRLDNFKTISREIVENIDDLSTPHTRELFRWWKSYQPNYPKRSDFDITEHAALAPYIYLVSVVSPDEFIYRLNGEEVASLVGRSYRMRPISTSSEDVGDRLFAQYLSEILKEGKACRCAGDLWIFDRAHLKFESVDCPLTDKNGEITHILGVLEGV
ncbi:MAG: PAS domain-containing protein [Sneathiella sp.]